MQTAVRLLAWKEKAGGSRVVSTNPRYFFETTKRQWRGVLWPDPKAEA